MKNYLFGLIVVIIFSIIPLSSADPIKYDLDIDGKKFNLSYIFDGKLISMDIDKESKSLLIGTTDVSESQFAIYFPTELLSAKNNEFVALIDQIETDYIVTHIGDNTKISLTIPADSEEIEIIGTSVIPEFPFGILAVMGIVSVIAILFSKTTHLKFR